MTAICLLTATTQADPADHLPPGTRTGDSICYDLPQFKVLLTLAANYEDADAERDNLNKKVDAQKEMIDIYAAAEIIQDDIISSLEVDRDIMFEKWKDENKRRHVAENVPQWVGSAGWIVAGVMTLVAAGAVTYAVTK